MKHTALIKGVHIVPSTENAIEIIILSHLDQTPPLLLPKCQRPV